MSAFAGQWEIYGSENFEEYMKAIGVSDEMCKTAGAALSVSSKLVQNIAVAGDAWTVSTITPMGERSFSFKIGEDFETKTLDGRSIMSRIVLENDSLVENQTGPDFQSTNIRTIIGGEMHMTMTSGSGVSCTRKYKKVE